MNNPEVAEDLLFQAGDRLRTARAARKRASLDDIVESISVGGDALESKKRIQRIGK